MKHLTPRYIFNRLRILLYEKAYPEEPWLTPAANRILDSYIKSSDTLLEFGSGRSTVWFAKRVAKVISVEHHKAWHKKVRKMLDDEGVGNVTYRFVREDADMDEDSALDANYVNIIDDFDNNSLDACLVDGIYRGSCALRVLDKIKLGGLLIIDNANLYLPSNSCSPNSRSFSDGPRGEIWSKVEDSIASWRSIWTSSGVTDTALYFKP